MSKQQIHITIGKRRYDAVLDDNATARAFIAQLPTTLRMLDLYGRELTYRYPQKLPTDHLMTSGYEIGDIAYWAPRHSFVIFYAQNGEVISELQHVGHIDFAGNRIASTGDTKVTFEKADH